MSKTKNIMPVVLIGNHPVSDSMTTPPVRHRFLTQFPGCLILSRQIKNRGNYSALDTKLADCSALHERHSI
jgi:hypothetical protein